MPLRWSIRRKTADDISCGGVSIVSHDLTYTGGIDRGKACEKIAAPRLHFDGYVIWLRNGAVLFGIFQNELAGVLNCSGRFCIH
jgi:hypothetical protein